MTSLDSQYASWIRKRLNNNSKQQLQLQKSGKWTAKKEVLLIANKAEGSHMSDRVLDTVSEALDLGLGDPILISAAHGEGLADLAQALIEAAKSRGLDQTQTVFDSRTDGSLAGTKISLEERTIQLAIMGKPNVGKSSFVNAVLGEERVIVGPTPGLTRYRRVYIHANMLCIIWPCIQRCCSY